MANVRKYIQIDPIDNRENVALGIRFPFNAGGVFYSTYTTKEQSKNNLLNILLTQPGERIFQPNFGVGLRQLLFENVIDTEKLKQNIISQTNLYLSQITILDIQANKNPNEHTLFITITFRVNQTNEEETIQLNFNTDQNSPTGDNLGTQY